VEQGATAIVVLGGDGTHRVVAKACGDTPICALSTGTNNAFPEMREATVAGLAAGLATDLDIYRDPAIEVGVNGATDLALVDVAVSAQRFIGARALWRAGSIAEVFVANADPATVGLSAIAGMVAPNMVGVHVTLGPGERIMVPIAPGLVVPVEIASFELFDSEPMSIAGGAGCLALDGEREIEGPASPTTVRLIDGPHRIDIDAVMHRAAATRLQPVQE
jgi:hypothetical protein